ncbi:MAG TPA: hypothetical protein VFY10_09075 [Dehalococcoidia bacterium]|nr:hypothetical protein [Dehalococcoidia bacterium]
MTTLSDLNAMSQEQLDDLFREAKSGPIPDGNSNGIAIVAPGTKLEGLAERFIHWLAWRGKVFHAGEGYLKNKVTFLSIPAVKAKVYEDMSWFDGQPAIILDYSKTSFIAHKVRDEIREVSPGLFLGQVFWGKKRIINFALSFASTAAKAA